MMHEIKRVLRKDGILIISSPNKYEYSDITGFHNKFHPKELYFEEFEKLIQKNFINYKFLGQRVVFGSVIASTENSIFLSWIKGKSLNPTKGLNNILYYIALASDITIPKYPTSIYQTSLENSDFARYMNNNLSEINKIISDLLNSNSWKLTAPLRKFKSFIKKWNPFKG